MKYTYIFSSFPSMQRLDSGFKFFTTLLCAFAFILSDTHLFSQCPITVSAGPDKYTCLPPTPQMLEGSIDGTFLNFNWTPTAGLLGPNSLTPNANVSQTTTYVLTAKAEDETNLIENGTFVQGNTGFSSTYNYSPGDLWLEGTYDVLGNPQSSHSNFAPCDDHSGDGSMMCINGAGTAGANVWCSSAPVMPNTDYVFSAWICSVISASPAQLQFSINGQLLGGIFTAPAATCVWVRFYAIWNSGSNGSASICLVNQNTALSGNDFALDDIGFHEICKVTDSVTVHAVNVLATAAPTVVTIPCTGASVSLNGTGSSVGDFITYQWTTANGNIVSGENTLTPVIDAPGLYTLNVTFDNGETTCTKMANVNVIQTPNPLIPIIAPPQALGCQNQQVSINAAVTQPGPMAWQWETSNGNFVSGDLTASPIVNQPGTYNVTVTNTATGCTGTNMTTVVANGTPPTALASGGLINCNSATTTLSSAGSSAGGVTYAWSTTNGTISGSTNTANTTASSAGTYLLTVTNPTNGCVSTDTAVVTANTALPTVSLQPPGTINCAVDTLTLSSATTPNTVNFVWTAANGGHFAGGQTTGAPKVDKAGTYAVTVTNPANGCTATATVSVTANLAQPQAIIAAPDSIDCQSPSVTLQSSGNTGANFGYSWTASAGGNFVSGQNTLAPVVNAAGTYTLVVTNTQNFCTASANVQVWADTNAVKAIANGSNAITCSIAQVSINSNGSSAGASMTYTWSTSNGTLVSGQNSNMALVSAPGTYQLLVTNTANGCSATDLVTILEDKTPPNVQIAAPAQLSCTITQTMLQAQNNSPMGNYGYAWSTSGTGNISSGANTLTPTVTAAGTYILTTTNLQTGCTSTKSVAVQKDNSTPTATVAAAPQITCATPQISLNGTGSSTGANMTYNWSTTGSGNIVSGPNTLNPAVSAGGTYVLTVTNSTNQCTATATATVLENKTAPPADAGMPGLLTCANPVLSLAANAGSPTGNLMFKWTSNNGGNFIGNTNAAQVDCNAPGTYLLTVTNPDNGCSTTDEVIVTANKTLPDVSIAPPSVITCAQAIVSLAANSTVQNLVFQWNTANGEIISGQNSATPSVSKAGNYAVTVTNPANGCSATATVTVTQNAVFPAADAGVSPTLTCATLQVPLNATADQGANITYAWATQNGNIQSGNNTLSPIVTLPGLYVLSVSNQQTGCTATSSVEVLENKTPPIALAGANDTLNCGVANLPLNGAGSSAGNGFSYLWTTPNGSLTGGQNTLTPTINAPGTYILQVTNNTNGCIKTDAVEIVKDSNAPLADAGMPSTLTCSITQTTLSGNASAGPNITYAWSGQNNANIVSGANTLSPIVDEPGIYLLTVTNTANGCTSIASVTIPEDVALPITEAGNSNKLTCATTSLALSGSASGAGNLTYQWTSNDGNIVSGANTLSPTINRAGTYTLTVNNLQNGCSNNDVVTVSIDTLAPQFVANAPAILTCTQNVVTVNGNVSQPSSGNFTALWTANSPGANLVSGQNTLNAMVNEAGFYQLLILNTQNGCTKTSNVQVQENTVAPMAEAGPAGLVTCTQTSATLNGTGSSSGTNFTYAWTGTGGGVVIGGASTLQPTAGAAGIYTLTVTDATNGCTATDVANVTTNTFPPPVNIAAPEVLNCLRSTIPLVGTTTNLPNLTTTWTTTSGHFVSGQNTLNAVVDAPGTYILNIENQDNGCIGTQTVVVAQNIVPPAAEAGPSQTLHCNNASANLQGSSATGTNMAFAWSTNNGHFTGAQAIATPAVDEAGLYVLVVTNPANGCTATDNVSISAIPDPTFETAIEQPDCHFQTAHIEIPAVFGGQAPFQYALTSGQAFQASNQFEDVPPGAFDLTVRDANGCTSTETVVVNEPFLPQLSIPLVNSLEFGDSVQLQAITNILPGNVASWAWTPAANLSCANCPDPWVRPFQNALYALTVVDKNGCSARSSITLRVKRDRNLFAPNAISPNNDGDNDVFTIYGKGVVRITNLRVFDRWGNNVFWVSAFESGDESMGWKGDFKGKLLNPAVFVWMAEVEWVDGKRTFEQGDVAIIKQ